MQEKTKHCECEGALFFYCFYFRRLWGWAVLSIRIFSGSDRKKLHSRAGTRGNASSAACGGVSPRESVSHDSQNGVSHPRFTPYTLCRFAAFPSRGNEGKRRYSLRPLEGKRATKWRRGVGGCKSKMKLHAELSAERQSINLRRRRHHTL